MAFTVKEKDAAENNKQHLNLSVPAYKVIWSDMFTFGADKLSGFINAVFEYYCPIAEASISRMLNCLNGELSKLLSDIPGDDQTKKRVLDRLVMQKKNSLIEKADSYADGRPFKFWLNRKNLEYLTEENSECDEDLFYSRRGKYIKCVLEEYARLPYIEREKIYFSPFIQAIEHAVQQQHQLRIVTGADAVYSVYPYQILCDPLSTANYLVGYCKRYNFPEDEKQPCSFRISALKSVKVEKSKSAFLKDCSWKQLMQKIELRGVQFMAADETEIHVRLTDEGVYKYRRQTHLRPEPIERRDGNIFVFHCTPDQAEFYFFKFGKDAEILFPLSLRDKFRSIYKDAANKYEKTIQEEIA